MRRRATLRQLEGTFQVPNLVEFKRSLAVIIGINEYAHGIPQLRTPMNDAARLAQVLADDHGYDVHLLTQEVTYAALTDFFTTTLPELNLGQQDRLLLYFAGHGIALDGNDGPAGYLIPQDARAEERASFLPMTDLHNWLSALHCRHLLAILDCCFAGAFRWASTRHLQPLPAMIYKERYDRFLRDPAWQVLTSAAYDQKALDLLAGNIVGQRDDNQEHAVQPHSPFALALFAALAGAGDVTPKGGDGVVTATELYLYLRDTVEVEADTQLQHRQTPGLWPLKKHDKGEYIFLVPGHTPQLPPAPALTTANNPYRGLQAYDEKDADLFFGRQQLVKKLATLVADQPLTVVVGASGTGKSSLVKAGLLPRLRALTINAEQADPSSNTVLQYHILKPLRPTETPLAALAQLTATLIDDEEKPEAPPPATNPSRSDPTLMVRHHQEAWEKARLLAATHLERWLATHPTERLLLVIDQFEELITLCHDEWQRTQFQALLAHLLVRDPARVRIVLTLRTDFEPQFADSPLAAYWQAGRFVVPLMSQAELREVIEGPASVRVLFFEPNDLVDTLIDEVIQTPGALPLLSFTLEQLYLKYLHRQEVAQAQGETLERAMTLADYAALGGVIGSLRTRADEEYAQLPDDSHRQTMQRVMLRMVALEGGELARRRVPLTELVYPSAVENTRVHTVLDQLVDSRLLVTDSADTDRDGTADAYVEPAHDALVRAWDRLLHWQQDFGEYLTLQRTLTAAAMEWARAGRDAHSGLLWNNNPRLPQLQAVLAPAAAGMEEEKRFLHTLRQLLWPSTQMTTEPTWLNQLESEFVQSSAARRATVLKRIVGITLAVIIVLSGLTLFAFDRQQQATANAKIAIAQRDTARSREFAVVAQNQLTENAEQAILLALAANAIARTFESENVLRMAVHASPLRATLGGAAVQLRSAAFAPDGSRLLVTGERTGEPFAELLAFPSLRVLLTLAGLTGGGVYGGSFSPDGAHILTLHNDDTVHLWNVADGKEILAAPATAAAWFPDGSAIVTVNRWDATPLQVWDLQLGKVVTAFGAENEAPFDPDQLYVTHDQQQVILFSLQTTGYVAQAWALQSGDLVAQFAPAGAAALSPDGTVLAYGEEESDMDNILLRDTLSQQVVFTTTGHALNINQIVFSPTGHQLASAGGDGAVRVWMVADTGAIAILSSPITLQEDGVEQMAFAPDGSLLLTESRTVIKAWHTDASATPILSFPTGAERIRQLTFAPQGHLFLTIDDAGKLQAWSTNFGEEWATIEPPASRQTNQVVSQLSPDSRHVALARGDTITRYDLAQRVTLSTTLALTESVKGLAFSPDGTALAAYGANTVAGWEMANGEPLGARQALAGTVLDIALAANGQRAAAVVSVPSELPDFQSDQEQQVVLWDMAQGKRQPLVGDMPHYLNIDTLVFAPDGATLLVSGSTQLSEAGANHLARLWDVTTGSLRFGLDFGPETKIHYTPDGEQLVVVRRESITLRDAHDGTVRATIPAGDREFSAEAMSITADGRRLLVPDAFSTTARVWDLESLKALVELRGHNEAITFVQFSQDGKRILTASARDGSVRLWDGETGELQTVLTYPNQQVTLSADGRFVLSQQRYSAPQVYLTHFDELIELAKQRVTRQLTCAERRDYLHEALECPVATPLPVAS
ncbi:MAG: caspase family protein [Caldilineaceae bacterium]